MKLTICATLLFALLARAEEPADKMDDIQEIKITAKRYAFTPKEITVEKGRKVRLLVTAMDVNHGFAIDAFKIRKKIDPESEEPTVIELVPDAEGEYEFYCAVFCGSGHDGMKGKLIVRSAVEQEVSSERR